MKIGAKHMETRGISCRVFPSIEACTKQCTEPVISWFSQLQTVHKHVRYHYTWSYVKTHIDGWVLGEKIRCLSCSCKKPHATLDKGVESMPLTAMNTFVQGMSSCEREKNSITCNFSNLYYKKHARLQASAKCPICNFSESLDRWIKDVWDIKCPLINSSLQVTVEILKGCLGIIDERTPWISVPTRLNTSPSNGPLAHFTLAKLAWGVQAVTTCPFFKSFGENIENKNIIK